jgi:hypothetical protein
LLIWRFLLFPRRNNSNLVNCQCISWTNTTWCDCSICVQDPSRLVLRPHFSLPNCTKCASESATLFFWDYNIQ